MTREELERVVGECLVEIRAARDQVLAAEARIGSAFEAAEDEGDRLWFAERVVEEMAALTRETRGWTRGRVVVSGPKGVQ